MRVGEIAHLASSTALEKCVKCMLGDSRLCTEDVNLRGNRRVKHNAADIGGEKAHHSKSQPGAIGDAIEIDLSVTKSMNQIVNIGCIGNGCICL